MTFKPQPKIQNSTQELQVHLPMLETFIVLNEKICETFKGREDIYNCLLYTSDAADE